MQEAKIFLSFFRVCTFSQQKFFISDLELLGNLEQFSLFLSQSPTVLVKTEVSKMEMEGLKNQSAYCMYVEQNNFYEKI